MIDSSMSRITNQSPQFLDHLCIRDDDDDILTFMCVCVCEQPIKLAIIICHRLNHIVGGFKRVARKRKQRANVQK